MIHTVGYTNLIQDMTEEEQKKLLSEKVNEKLILSETDKRRIVLTVLPEILEEGSIVYVTNLSVLGDKAYRIDGMLERYKHYGITIISLKENINTSINNDWCDWISKIAEVEKNAMYQKPVPKSNKKNKGGRKKIVITPEMFEVLVAYDSGALSVKEATKKLKCATTTLYKLLGREKENIRKNTDKDLILKAQQIQAWLKQVEKEN